ncbi:MAG TPA: hypothetical protein VFW06_01425 [Acidimicrobiia bacterium]|nr:hypothetical protein [Acidimicrobiia bacterium]
MGRIKVTAGLVIVGALALSAGVASAKPLPRSQWKAQADAICTQMYADLSTIQDELFGPNSPNPVPPGTPSATELAAFAAELVPVFKEAVVAIDGLKEPKALSRRVKQLKATAFEEAAAIEADPGILGLPEDPFPGTTKIGTKLRLTCG